MNTTSTTAPPAEIHTRAVEFVTRKIDITARTVELSFSSEAAVERFFGNEILEHSPSAVRLGRLNNGGALLLNHDQTKQIGVVVNARIDADRKGRATVRFGTGPLAQEIFQDVQDGIRRLVSVGYRIHKQVSQGTKAGVETVRVTDWEPHELSLVSIPADDSVGIGRSIETAPGNSTIEPTNSMNNLTNAATERIRCQRIAGIAEQYERQTGRRLETHAAIESGEPAENFQQRILDDLCSRSSNYNPGAGRADDFSPGELRDIGRFSIGRAIAELANGRALSGIERELNQEGLRISKGQGLLTQGNLILPLFVLSHRDLTATGGSNGDQGGTMIGITLGQHIPLFNPKNVLRELGASFITGLTGNFAFPRMVTGSTATHKTETGALDESSPTFDQVPLSPCRMGTFVEVSKQLLAQSAESMENIVRNDLISALTKGIQNGALNGSGGNSEPLGILATPNIGDIAGGAAGAAPTWDHIVGLEGEICDADADGGRLGYLTNSQVRRKLKGTIKATGFQEFSWGTGGLLNDYPALTTSQVPHTLSKGASGAVCSAIIFGNWADLLIALWGGLDIQVNPYSKDTEGLVRIVAAAFYDSAVRRPKSFAAMKDALTA